MRCIVGIDFGSATCRTALAREGGVEVFSNRFSGRLLPISFAAGAGALPLRVRTIKEELGGHTVFPIGGRDLPVHEAAAVIFRDLFQDALEQTNGELPGAVVGAPACFLEGQRAALQAAAEAGGFPRVRVVNEAVATLLEPESLKQDRVVLVYALGAGGFCATVVRVARGAVHELCHEGQAGLGGHLFTAAVMAAILEQLGLAPAHLRDPRESPGLLRDLAETVKRGLSRSVREEFDVPLWELFREPVAGGGGFSRRLAVSREAFENRIAPLVEETIRLARTAVERSGVARKRIETLVLVGDASRTPLVEQRLREEFTVPAVRAAPDAVAVGLAWYGAQLPPAEWAKIPPKPAAAPEPPRQPVPPPVAEARAAAPLLPPLLPVPEARAEPAEEASWVAEFTPTLNQAQAAWSRGDLAETFAQLDKLVRLEIPQFVAHLHLRRGKAFLQAGRYDDAVRAFLEARQQDKTDPALVRYLGYGYHLRGRALMEAGEYDAAIESLGTAVHYDKASKGAWADLHHAFKRKARSLYETGRYVVAKMALQEALKIDPRCPSCREFAAELEAAARARPKSARTPSSWRRRSKKG